VITVENEPDPDPGLGADGVDYVDDGVPLYYRDWRAVFTDLGLVEVATTEGEGERDTTRAFRPPGRVDR
jgi:hypothetical protein